MRYPDEHWERVAKLYMSEYQRVKPKDLTGGKTEETVVIAKIQNRYPDTTYNTVQHWVRKCRQKGLI